MTTLTRSRDLADVTDGRLHQQILGGDPPACTELYRRHSPAVYRTARAVIKDPDLAQDVTQDVFLEFFRRPEGADLSRGSLPGYLKMVARRRSIDSIRSLACSRRREADSRVGGRLAEQSHGPAEPGELVAHRSDCASIRHHLEHALLQLPEAQQKAVQLAFYDGQTYRQVAATLAIPEGTAKSRLRAALHRLSRDPDLLLARAGHGLG